MKNKEALPIPKTEEEQQLEKLGKLENANSVIKSVLMGLRAGGNYSDKQIKEIEETLREKFGIPDIVKN